MIKFEYIMHERNFKLDLYVKKDTLTEFGKLLFSTKDDLIMELIAKYTPPYSENNPLLIKIIKNNYNIFKKYLKIIQLDVDTDFMDITKITCDASEWVKEWTTCYKPSWEKCNKLSDLYRTVFRNKTYPALCIVNSKILPNLFGVWTIEGFLNNECVKENEKFYSFEDAQEYIEKEAIK